MPNDDLRKERFPARRPRRRAALAIFLWAPALALAQEPAAPAVSAGDALDAQERAQRAARTSQDRVDALDDETLALLAEYHAEIERAEDLETYNLNLRNQIESQSRERTRLEGELAELDVVRQALVPLMLEMVGALERFVAMDQPMLVGERRARVQALSELLDRSDVELAEKYRRVIEAYQIEAEYGQSIEAYEGTLAGPEGERAVEFLRIGRMALYALSLDGSEAALWNRATKRWEPVAPSHLDGLDYALRMARKQVPPNLIRLPLFTGEAPR